MSHAVYKRLTRYAFFSFLQVPLGLTVVSGGPTAGWAGVALVCVWLSLLWAWGLYQADVALNPVLDETDRNRWRIAIFCVPGSMALYWLRHVRAHGALDSPPWSAE